MNYLLPPRLDALARDYAVGTLRGRARRRFERVLHEAPEARRAVAAWQQRLARLAEEVPEAAPREVVWEGIERVLFGDSVRGKRLAAAQGWRGWFTSGSGAAGAKPASLGLAVGLVAGALLAVAALRWQPPWAARVGLEAASPGLPEAYVGILMDPRGQAVVLASSRRHGRVLTIKWLRPTTLPPGQVARLWALPKDGSAPVSIGVLPPPPGNGTGSGTMALAAPSETLFFKVDRLAVDLEPAGGPAGAAPTRPYIAEGACAKLW